MVTDVHVKINPGNIKCLRHFAPYRRLSLMSKLQPARGTHDLWGEDYKKHQNITSIAEEVARRFGFQGITTPIFEFTQVFKRTLGDTSDIVHKEMYTFVDRGNEEITLRPEGTAPIVRAFISNGLTRQLPFKAFYNGPMFRYERPQKGRLRQFHQVGVEHLGADKPRDDIEVIAMAALFLKELGLQDQISLDINSIGDTQSRLQYREKLVNYLQQHETQLSEDSQRRLSTNPLRILDSKDEKDQDIIGKAPRLHDSLNAESKEMFDEVCAGLDLLKIPYNKNPRLVRGLDYYCHCVFEFKAKNLGAQDTVLAGGRYDGLVEQMGGPTTTGVGWASGIERLALIYEPTLNAEPLIALIPLGEQAEKESLKLAQTLRENQFIVECVLSGNMSKRLKKADRLQAKKAVIFSDEDLAKSQVEIKNLESGTQVTLPLAELSTALRS